MKKVFSILFALLLVITIVPMDAFMIDVSAATSGKTGECTWKLDGTVLTISGNGAMGNYDNYSNLAPWGQEITEVIIEKGVTKIGNYAFYYCRSLTSATLSDGVTIIGTYSFAFCTSLKSITIPNSIESFGDGAFDFCSSLPGIVIPDGVTSIGSKTFYYCSKIKDITIPNSVNSIGEDAFLRCNFKSIVIPSSVTSIGAGAFSYCNALTSIEVDENNATYYSVNNCIIKKSTNELVVGCNSSVIPNGVTSIGEDSFNGFTLANITIPSGVTRINGWAFTGCDLTSITIPKSVTDIAYGAFYLCDKLADVYYSGNRLDQKKINIGGSNSELTNAKWHYAPCENDAHSYSNDCATICKNCDYIRTASISHIYDHDCDETCNVCGEQRKSKHIYTKVGENTATCKVCNLSKTFDFIITTDETITLSYDASKEFDFKIENTSIAKISNVSSSIVSMGSYYNQVSSAKVLSVYPGETVVKIVATNGTILTTSSLLVVEGEHQMQLSEVLKEVSCTEPGKELYVCKFCDHQEEKTIENTGHAYDNTCDTNCNVCGGIRTINHEYEWIIDKENNCGIDGLMHEECSVCHTMRNAGTVIDATGDHNFGWIIDKPENCGINGLKHEECSVCHTVRNAGTVIDATDDHTYDNACDKICNVCELERDTEHDFGDDYVCDVCQYGECNIAEIFPDTSNNAWYTDAVSYAYSRGILKGYANGKFGVSDGIQRQDFLAMLARFDGADLSLYEDMHGEFKDVGRNAYYESSVNWGKSNNIVSGYNDGRFGVGDKITREQIVTFLWRYAQYKGLDVSVSDASKQAIKNQYKDFGKVSTFSQEAVLWALDRGVIGGKDPQTIAPQGNAQRCEVAQIMYNIFKKNIF